MLAIHHFLLSPPISVLHIICDTCSILRFVESLCRVSSSIYILIFTAFSLSLSLLPKVSRHLMEQQCVPARLVIICCIVLLSGLQWTLLHLSFTEWVGQAHPAMLIYQALKGGSQTKIMVFLSFCGLKTGSQRFSACWQSDWTLQQVAYHHQWTFSDVKCCSLQSFESAQLVQEWGGISDEPWGRIHQSILHRSLSLYDTSPHSLSAKHRFQCKISTLLDTQSNNPNLWVEKKQIKKQNIFAGHNFDSQEWPEGLCCSHD